MNIVKELESMGFEPVLVEVFVIDIYGNVSRTICH